MRGQHKAATGSLIFLAAALVTEPGCSTPARRSIVGGPVASSSEPALSPNPSGPEVAVIDPPSSASTNSTKTASILDRHPLLRKPQQYYDNTNSNKAVKTAAATFVGVPAGIVGELKQIVVGRPSAAPPTAY